MIRMRLLNVVLSLEASSLAILILGLPSGSLVFLPSDYYHHYRTQQHIRGQRQGIASSSSSASSSSPLLLLSSINTIYKSNKNEKKKNAVQNAKSKSMSMDADDKNAAFLEDPSRLLGAQPPFGLVDPLGILKKADTARFNRLRYVELKHGRIAMLAVVGHIVTTAGVRLPGNIADGVSFASIPSGLAALPALPINFALFIVLGVVGVLELFVMKDVTGTAEFVGDFRNDGAFDLGWDTLLSVEEQERKRAIELNNGRAAQMGILALMVHEQLPSHDPYMINALIGYPIDFNAGF